MKARDLAALAALGVAGYAAYDKFGRKKDEDKKGEAPKTRGELGDRKSSINEGTEGEYRKQDTGKTISVNDGDAGESDARMRKRSRQENDVPDRIMGQDAAGSRFTDKAAAVQDAYGAETMRKGVQSGDGGAAARALLKKKSSGPAAPAAPAAAVAPVAEDRTPAPVVTKDYPRPFVNYPNAPAYTEATPEQKIAAIDAASGASHPSTKKTEALAAYSRAEAAKDLEKKKANGTFVPIPQNVKPAATTPTAVTPSAPVSAAAAARQQAIDEKNYNSDLMKNRRQSVIDTLQGIPSGIANIFKPPEQVFQNKTYVKDGKVVRYNKGGVVKKMASGGLASSRMSSKPSTASSRGDGIAQRGKTRGQMR